MNPTDYDVIVIGAGAAGMMCAAQAGQRGRRVLLIDHAAKIGERIRISGGGRCNFTNRNISAENFLSQNPHFARSALARYSQFDFIKLVQRYRIAYHEKTSGQLFCDDSARQIIDMLRAECDAGGVQWAQPCSVHSIEQIDDNGLRFELMTDHGTLRCQSLVIASGGLAIPKLGATPFGYKVAEQFKLPVIAPKPALVPLALATETLAPLEALAGASLDVATHCEDQPREFREGMLITHRGLSGPAILQISSYWQMQEYGGGKKRPIVIDLLPGVNAADWIAPHRHSKITLASLLAEHLPKRFAQEWCALHNWTKPLAEHSRRDLDSMISTLKSWTLMPAGTLGYAKAEVTLGGVDTNALSSKTMETKTISGLYFIGEVVDVTGWLGGYNFQWAWSSGWVAGQYA
ncbi:NAD(FAD)-utilizing dehydrogenases [Sulfuriferula multivorans]|uniref:NAD(FAD)-utilizing dehydrogenases n=1 Tax=Sulfuriferula multivorans TaxID=1559896 RepID=A0A401JZC0_9PROT|nr:NAD(P)/FAD-dependent oxidoreductase [Sulfuriferula multivorans]GCB02081.1 NAD(FAD)-utilizing dehydrogenases [Sulfuriferula multivorans]